MAGNMRRRRKNRTDGGVLGGRGGENFVFFNQVADQSAGGIESRKEVWRAEIAEYHSYKGPKLSATRGQ